MPAVISECGTLGGNEIVSATEVEMVWKMSTRTATFVVACRERTIQKWGNRKMRRGIAER
jgi:hypothetical protein